ncbi:radical SAM protein [Rhodococcus sp. SGAir0479]|uniref:radical SAM protein n=1 Tax=Rhodococcus sp. SGAir0479 TaxID=2567884 RepID=UPI0015866E8C|nr:radical SAM protein [Rhodococcus sp. SGAir0479]
MTATCAACDDSPAKSSLDECRGAFSRIGLSKIHWECWSECNLHCKFCYRSVDTPLTFDNALQLIEISRYAGIDRFVFAGGDPSLRSDLPALIDFATSIGLSVELQSNFQKFSKDLQERILDGKVALTGISLDGGTANKHDNFRSTRGNFKAVINALDFHEQAGRPAIVRTIVSRQNSNCISDIGKLLTPYRCITRWSLLEFTPIGDGFTNRNIYSISATEYEEIVASAIESYEGLAEVDVFRASAKLGTYGMVTPAGLLYGVISPPSDGKYPIVGSMLERHLNDLASSLPFDRQQHLSRYSTQLLGGGV